MRLRAARVRPYALRLAQPLETAHGRYATREGALLELEDTAGHRGLGEAAPWPGFGTESLADSIAALQGIAALLPQLDAEPGEWPDPLAEALRLAPAARAALDGALWDLAAQRAGLPLAALLAARHGGNALKQVQTNALLTAQEPPALRAQALQARAAGYRAAKLKLGAAGLDEDLARVAAAREGLGPDLALRGDANGAWQAHQAREALAALAPFGLEYVEQPLPAADIEGLARLRSAGLVRIAADESVSTEQGLERLLAAGAADVLVLKPAALGGPGAALGLARRARRAGCEVVFTHALESAIGACHALHCAAAWGHAATVHGLATAGLFENDLATPPACRRGLLAVPAGAGLGLGAPS